MILLLSISILLSFYRNTKVRNILLSIHFFALLLAASATTIFVGIISFLLYLFRHKLTPLLVVAVMFAGTSFFSIVVLELLYIYLPEGFLQNRISSALASTFNYSAVFSPFGESRNLKEYGRGNFLQTYGVLGFLLLQIFLYCFWVKIFYVIRCGSKVVGNNRVEFAMLLIMACFYVYPLTVFNDLFTLLNVLSFLLIYSIYNSYRKNICYKIRYSMVKG